MKAGRFASHWSGDNTYFQNTNMGGQSGLVVCIDSGDRKAEEQLAATAKSKGATVSFVVNNKVACLITSVERLPLSARARSARRCGVPLVDKAVLSQDSLSAADFDKFLLEKPQQIVASKPTAFSSFFGRDDDSEDEEKNFVEETHKKVASKCAAVDLTNKILAAGELQRPWQNCRVFISSTFKDMHGERDHLTRTVFPELKERALGIHVHVSPVDLRWGITEEESENILEICLSEVDNCRPFFVGIYGERYGWRIPSNYTVNNPHYANRWKKGWSITHAETHYGALADPSKSRAAFFFRNRGVLDAVPSLYRGEFEAEDEDSANRLELLKEELREHFPVVDYNCTWKGEVEGKPMVTDLDSFGEQMLETLWEKVVEEYPVKEEDLQPPDSLSISRAQHESFVEHQSRSFVGRQTYIRNLWEYVERRETRPLAIWGHPGSGKSSLTAAFARNVLVDWESGAQGYVIPHFVGVAAGSTDLRNMLQRFCGEIARLFDLNKDFELSYAALKDTFLQFLEQASIKLVNSSKQLVLIIDALNQFAPEYNPWNLEWLPKSLPERVKIVVSFLPGKYKDAFEGKMVKVEPLEPHDRQEIVEQTLMRNNKKVTAEQMKLIMKKEDSNRPLFLVVMCEELRVFGVHEQVTDKIKSMSGTLAGILSEVLQRLESDHGQKLVTSALCFVASVRGGLEADEMLELLGCTVNEHLFTQARNFKQLHVERWPTTSWARLRLSLQAYLRPSSSGILDFFHEQVKFAVQRRYLTRGNGDITRRRMEMECHRHISVMFRNRADPDWTMSWSSQDPRGLSELPFHQINGFLWEDVAATLTDLKFIESKCEAEMAFDIVADLMLAEEVIESNDWKELNNLTTTVELQQVAQQTQHIKEFLRFAKGRVHILSLQPGQTFALAANFPPRSLPCRRAMERWNDGKETRPWMDWINKPQSESACLLTLAGHSLPIRECRIRPGNPSQALSASDDRTMKLWDMERGSTIRTFTGHRSGVLCVCFSPDGKKILSGSHDKSAMIWDVETGNWEETLDSSGDGEILGVAWSSAGILVTADASRQIRFYRGNTLLRTHTVPKPPKCVAFSEDGKFLACAGESREISLFSHSNDWQSPIAQIPHGHRKKVRSLEFGVQDGTRVLLSASDDKTARIFREVVLEQTGSCEWVHSTSFRDQHKDQVSCATFVQDAKKVVTVSHDNVVIVWDALTSAVLSMFVGHTGTAFWAVAAPDDKTILTASYDRTLKIWNMAAKDETVGHSARILGVNFSKTAPLVATAARDKTLKVWDTNTLEERNHLKGHGSNVYGCAFHPKSSHMLASASRDFSLRLWDLERNTSVKFEGHKSEVSSCVWNIDGSRLLSSSYDKTVKIWDPNTQQAIHTLYGHRDAVNCVDVSPDGNRIVTASSDRTLKLWDARTRAKVATFSGHTAAVRCCAFSGDSLSVLSGSDDCRVKLWNAKNAKVLTTISKHRNAVTSCCFTPDEYYFVTCSTDSTVQLWNADTYNLACSYQCLSRLTSVDTIMHNGHLQIALGDGSGCLYVMQPMGLESQ